ncbi:hypothetical protein L1987_12928 [Smallanthus sonchifolius]|uniref:Uncharacterized protein n=1 Tax=Smallanthus sonchifolius TaxID=185202 RepID=A0ACB9JFP9_9ASTR|nr:hypothetical protein L1987_12928 [Smallanthus sonchifolius]
MACCILLLELLQKIRNVAPAWRLSGKENKQRPALHHASHHHRCTIATTAGTNDPSRHTSLVGFFFWNFLSKTVGSSGGYGAGQDVNLVLMFKLVGILLFSWVIIDVVLHIGTGQANIFHVFSVN